MKTVIRIFVTLIFSLLLSIMIYYHTNYDEIMAKIFGIGVLEIQSGSMESELSVGDIIIIKECENYEVNDIITYQVNDEYLVTHRIIERNGNNFVTKGDSNNVADNEKVSKDKIEGKMICNSKLLKWIYNHWIITVLVFFIILIIF